MATIILIGWTYWEECGGLFPSVYIKSLFWWKGDPLIKIKKSQWKFRKLNYSSRAKGTDMGKGRVVKPVHTSPLGLRAVPVLRQEEPSSCWTSQLQEQTDWCCVSSMLGVSRTSEQGCGHNALRPELHWLGENITAQCWCPAELCQSAWSLPEEVQGSTCTAVKEHCDPRAMQSILFPQGSLPELCCFSIWEELSL